MPGLAANDYGDSIRFGANHSAEDEPDLSKVNFSLELFEAYTKGFLEVAGNALTPLEIETLPWGGKTHDTGMWYALSDRLSGRRSLFCDSSPRTESGSCTDTV